MEFHKATTIFPVNEGRVNSMISSIRKHGLLKPIETMNGSIIDGRCRYEACRFLNVQPLFHEVYMTDPVAYVILVNLSSHKLSASQLGLCAARAKLLRKEYMVKGNSRDQVGALFGISGRTVDCGDKVLKNAIPEVIDAVERNHMPISVAALIADRPEEVQRTEWSNPPKRSEYRRKSKKQLEEENTNGHALKGVGVYRAHEAINSLARIPKNDALRKRGFQVVKDWIRQNS